MNVVVIAVLLAVALLLIGFAIVGLALKLLTWLLVGLVIGALARVVLPGEHSIGLMATSLFGIAGGLVGGILADHVLDVGGLGQFVLSVLGAAVLISVFTGASAIGGGRDA